MNQNIREYLATIVNDKNEKNWYKLDLFIKNTRSKLPKELEIIKNPPEEDGNYNCFIYVLGLHNDREIIKETKGFIYSNFFQTLIDKGELKLISAPQSGDIIIYRNSKKFGSEITHSGIVQENGTIISKWSWGPIIEHKIFDVPNFYGDEIQYIHKITSEQAKELFQKYKTSNINTHSE